MMNFIGRIVTVAAFGTFAASAVNAATITAMDSVDLSKDEVMFTVLNEAAFGITKIQLEVDTTVARNGARFILDDDANAAVSSVGGTINSTGEVVAGDRDGFDTLMINFDDAHFSSPTASISGSSVGRTWWSGRTAQAKERLIFEDCEFRRQPTRAVFIRLTRNDLARRVLHSLV